jgi:uncharacterized protein (DUF427 family)
MWNHKNNIDANTNNINDNNIDTKIYIPFKDINLDMLKNIEWVKSDYGTLPYYCIHVGDKPYPLFYYDDITYRENGEVKRVMGLNNTIN